VEMTRKRTRENLMQQLCEPCGYCEGRGYVLSSESVAYKVLREIRKDMPRFSGRQIAIAVNPRVAEVLLGPARQAQTELAAELGREIEIRARPGLHQEQFEVVALDAGPPVSLALAWLEEDEPKAAPTATDAAAEATGAAPAEAEPTPAAAVEGGDPPPESAGAAETPPDPSEAPPGDGAPPEEPARDRALDAAAEGLDGVAAAGTRNLGELLDVETESPILPAPEEREEL